MPSRRPPAWWGLAAVIALGTVGDAWRYVGAVGIALTAIWAVLAAAAIWNVASRIDWRTATRAAMACGLVAIAAFVAFHPRLNTHAAGQGSDRDDDADIAVRTAFHGGYPFDERTYLGNRITHMPGSLIVAAPFVALRSSALENLVVVPLGVLLLARRTRSPRALAVVVGGLVASAGVWHEWLTGSNSLSEWTLIVIAAVWLATETGRVPRALRAAAFGFAITVRANAFAAIAAPVASTARRDGTKAAARVAVVVGAVVAALTLPFLLHGFDRYSPLSSGTAKFAYLADLFPHAKTMVPVTAVLIGAAAAWAASSRRPTPDGVALALGVSQATSFAFLIAMSAIAADAYWARDWASYFVVAVVPLLAAIALRVDLSPRRISPASGTPSPPP